MVLNNVHIHIYIRFQYIIIYPYIYYSTVPLSSAYQSIDQCLIRIIN